VKSVKLAKIGFAICIIGLCISLVGMRIYCDELYDVRAKLARLDSDIIFMRISERGNNSEYDDEYWKRYEIVMTTGYELQELRCINRYSDFKYAYELFKFLIGFTFIALIISKSFEEFAEW